MALNTFLILGVVPANNEQEVPVNTDIVISFSKYMDISTLTEANIHFRKVNGESIPYTADYSRDKYQLTLAPNYLLDGLTQYQVEVVGGLDGIKSVTGDYTNTRTYEFTTVLTKSISKPRNLSAVQSGSRITASWTAPEVSTDGETVSYDVRVSASNDPGNPALWPADDSSTMVDGTNAITATSLAIPQDFELGRNYYVMVRARSLSSVGDWEVVQLYMEEASTEVTPTAPSTDGSTPVVTSPAPIVDQIEIVEVYPNQGDIIEDNTILIAFSDDLDILPTNAVYVVQAPYKATLSKLDLLTKYSPSKAVAGTVNLVAGETAIVQWVASDVLPTETSYTVVISKDIKGLNTDSLGVTAVYGCRTPYDRLFGDIKTIRERLGSYSSTVSDSFIYDFMNLNTKFAYETVSATSTFNSSDYDNGAAPYNIHQYVNLQTVYDVLLNSSTKSVTTGSAGLKKEVVTLGDLTVSKEMNAATESGASVSTILSSLKHEIKPWLDTVHGLHNRGYAKPSAAVKGEVIETYPDYFARSDLKTNFDA